MFGTEHLIWIAICVVFITVLTFISVKFKFSFKTSAFIMAGISLVSELSKIFTHMEFANGKDISDGMVIEGTALPFHLCSILIFVFFYLPFAKNEKIKNFLIGFSVPISIIGGLLAILIATSGTDFAKPYAYQCFVYHAGIIWFALYLLFTKQVKLGFTQYIKNIITLASLAIIMIWVNGMLAPFETNFFFVVKPPKDGLPLLNLDNGWYAYFATVMLLGFVLLTLVHLPALIRDFKSRDK